MVHEYHHQVIGMKRSERDHDDIDQSTDPNITHMAHCLMILQAAAAGRGEFMMSRPYDVQPADVDVISANELQAATRVFECKTCNRKFPSFQALGGHRASHKKPRQVGLQGDHPSSMQQQPSLALMISNSQQPAAKTKPKTHECSICGLEFAIGQALGGHMRRHRAATLAAAPESEPALSLSPPPPAATPPLFVVPPHVLKRSNSSSNSSKRICLDLNLTPKENGMDYHQYQNLNMIRPEYHDKVSPILHCYF